MRRERLQNKDFKKGGNMNWECYFKEGNDKKFREKWRSWGEKYKERNLAVGGDSCNEDHINIRGLVKEENSKEDLVGHKKDYSLPVGRQEIINAEKEGQVNQRKLSLTNPTDIHLPNGSEAPIHDQKDRGSLILYRSFGR